MSAKNMTQVLTYSIRYRKFIAEGMADLTEKKLVGYYLKGFEGHGIDLG